MVSVVTAWVASITCRLAAITYRVNSVKYFLVTLLSPLSPSKKVANTDAQGVLTT
jgi:hypothetical protein